MPNAVDQRRCNSGLPALSTVCFDARSMAKIERAALVLEDWHGPSAIRRPCPQKTPNRSL